MKLSKYIFPRPAWNWFTPAVLLATLLAAGSACSEPEFVNNGADGGDVESDVGGDSTTDDTAMSDMEDDVSACGDTCDRDTPLCDETNGTCVECLADTDCDAADRCTDTGVCVTCLEDDDCADGVCIEGPTPQENGCETCRDNGQCTDEAASACSDENTCESCTDHADCSHLSDTPICLDGADGARCVECITNDDCGGMVCNQLDNTCTDTSPGTAGQCEACVSDSQCDGDRRCLSLTFEGMPQGYYCVEIAGSADSCEGPYPVFESRTSLGGATHDFCLINESVTTCEAVLDFEDLQSDQCASGESLDDSLCGADGVEDGLCRDFDGSFQAKCTYRCESDSDCPAAFLLKCGNARSGGQGPKWCGGGE